MFFVVLGLLLLFREGERGEVRQKEGQNIKRGSKPSAKPNMRLDPTALKSCPEPRSRVGHLTN